MDAPMKTYEHFHCVVCKREVNDELGQFTDDGWVCLISQDGSQQAACPDHAKILLAVRDGRSNESLEVMYATIALTAQSEDGEARARLEGAATELAAAITARRARAASEAAEVDAREP